MTRIIGKSTLGDDAQWVRNVRASGGKAILRRGGQENVGRATLLFRANEQGSQIHIAGYAILRKGMFGWYIVKLQMTGKSPLPNDVMANLDLSEGAPVIYGRVFLDNAASVEAVFSDSNQGNATPSAKIPEGNFVLFGPQYSELTLFKIFDVDGNVLKQFMRDEL